MKKKLLCAAYVVFEFGVAKLVLPNYDAESFFFGGIAMVLFYFFYMLVQDHCGKGEEK